MISYIDFMPSRAGHNVLYQPLPNSPHVKLAMASHTAGDSSGSVDCFTTASSLRGTHGTRGLSWLKIRMVVRLLQARPDGPFGPADDLLCTTQGARVADAHSP